MANFLRKLFGKTPGWMLKLYMNFWSPFLGAAIKVTRISDDYRYIQVCLKYRWYNSNYVGSHFGGSIYAMTDPFYMLMLMNNLGTEYIVWDKGAKIDFIKPGKSNLIAEFRIDDSILNTVIEKTKSGEKYIFDLPVEVKDTDQIVVAKVDKTLYVRKKTKK
jgi:acyl-coenzyme A thioesterase PaaI-like protein